MPRTASQRLTADLAVGCKALADETRITIVALLRDGERCVCDLNDALGISQPLLSHHLRVLKEAGLVSDRRSGRWVYYELVTEAIEQLEELLADLRTPRTAASPPSRCCD